MTEPLLTDGSAGGAADVDRRRRIFHHLLADTLGVSVVHFTVWFAITFFVYLETRSVFATGIISGIYLTLTALSGLWFGSLVDHHRKKTVMVASTAVSLALYAACLGIYLAAGRDAFADPASVTLWVFVLVQMIGVITGNIRTIAMSTAVTLLIPADRRDRANGLVGTASGISFLVTSVISGILVGLAGMLYVLILAIAATAASIVHVSTLHIPGDGVAAGAGQPRKIDIRGTLAVVGAVPGLFALILFAAINNVLGGVLMALMDAYGLSLVSVQVWGLLWGFLSTGFILGGLVIARRGLGRNPLRALLLANAAIWAVSAVFTLRSSIVLLTIGMFIFLCVIPYIEASEQTVLQRVVPYERQGRVFGFAQSVEQSASPLTAFLISPVAQFVAIPFMTTGLGADLIGGWFGTGPERGLALVFTLTGLIGLVLTLVALRSPYYRLLSERYRTAPAAAPDPETQPA
jgi:DHA3 family multidrug efflux protein-like MFS transporter